MPVETPSLFAQVIQDHLELKHRNARLDGNLPLERYMSGDPFQNHPLFKTEEQARIEETMSGEEHFSADEWPLARDEDAVEAQAAPEVGESLWSRSRDFDWGD